MELPETAMTGRQRSFRERYRARHATWYSGPLHAATIYTAVPGVMIVFASQAENVRWWEWLVVPVVFLAANVAEWWFHRNVMHRPRPGRLARAIHAHHTLTHHRFFTDREIRAAGTHDWRFVCFSPWVFVAFVLASIPPALILAHLISANAGWLAISTATGLYLLYDFVHFCSHIEENGFVRNAPLVNSIRRHHAAHHDPRTMMDRNLNLTLPIADWLFGTSDLERGLLGHLFNGYDERYLKRGDGASPADRRSPSSDRRAGSVEPA